MGQANLFAVVACAGVLVMYQNLDQMQLNVVPYSQWPAVLSMKLMAQLAPSASSSPTQSTGQGAAQEMVDGGEDTNEIDLMKDDAQDLLRYAACSDANMTLPTPRACPCTHGLCLGRGAGACVRCPSDR